MHVEVGMNTNDIVRMIEEMKLGFTKVNVSKSKYNFNRANWYVAEFNVKDYTDVVHWCKEQFGPHPRNPDAWSRWWHKYEDKIHFRDENDYILFTLRWS